MADQFEQLKKDREYVNEKTTVLSDADQKKKKRNKIILTILFVLINIGAIVVTGIMEFTKESPEHITFDNNMVWLIGALGCIASAIFFETFKYCVMMRHTVGRVNIKHAFQTAVLGKYYDNITPSGAGGQPFQMYYLSKQGYAPGIAGAMPVLGFLSMQLGFCLLFFVLVCLNAHAVPTALHVMAYVGILFYLLVPMAIILFNFFPTTVTKILAWGVRVLGKMKILKDPEKSQAKMVSSLEEYRTALAEMAKVKGLILKVMLIGIAYQIALMSTPYFVLRAFGSPVTFLDVLTLTVYIYAGIAYIPTPGNAGAAEGTFYTIFHGLNSNTFWGMAIWRFLTYYLFLLMGVGVYGYNALMPKIRKRLGKEEKNDEEHTVY